MSLNLATQQLLSDGTKWFSYSGVRVGDITVPASVTLLTIDNTGLRDSLVKVSPYYSEIISATDREHLGISVTIDGIEVVNTQRYRAYDDLIESFDLFVPRQSSFQILSINTSANNLQGRGCNVIGWYL